MSPPSAIVLDTQAWSDLCYHVLAHVDLGEDAANLFDPTLPTTSWAPALHEAYTQRLQWLPLGRSTPDDPALLAPIEAEAERFMTRWQETAQARQHGLGRGIDGVAVGDVHGDRAEDLVRPGGRRCDLGQRLVELCLVSRADINAGAPLGQHLGTSLANAAAAPGHEDLLAAIELHNLPPAKIPNAASILTCRTQVR